MASGHPGLAKSIMNASPKNSRSEVALQRQRLYSRPKIPLIFSLSAAGAKGF